MVNWFYKTFRALHFEDATVKFPQQNKPSSIIVQLMPKLNILPFEGVTEIIPTKRLAIMEVINSRG